MTKTPKELADDWANAESDLWFSDINTYSEEHKDAVKQGFLAGYEAGRKMSNKEIFEEYIRLREKHQVPVIERIKVKIMGIFG